MPGLDLLQPFFQAIRDTGESFARRREEALHAEDRRFQRQQIERQNARQDRADANDDADALAQRMQTARMVSPGGTVMQRMLAPTTAFGMAGDVPVMGQRKADPDRIVSYRSADGKSRQFELMTPDEIDRRRVEMLLNQRRAENAVNLQGKVNEQQALMPGEVKKAGFVAGAQQAAKNEADAAARKAAATQTLAPYIADYYGFDKDALYTPEEVKSYTVDYSKGKRQQEHDAAIAEKEWNRILQQQKFQAGENAKNRATTMAAAQIRNDRSVDQNTFNNEDKLRKEFQGHKGVRAYQEVKRYAALARQGVSLAAKGDANGGDQLLINALNKIVDPNSVVREGEYARTAAGQSAINRLKGTFDRIANGGGGLSQVERESILRTVDAMERASADSYKPLEGSMRKTAKAYGLNADRILLSEDAPVSGSGSPAAGGGKVLDEATARQFLEQAGGDKQKARALATQNGWKVQ